MEARIETMRLGKLVSVDTYSFSTAEDAMRFAIQQTLTSAVRTRLTLPDGAWRVYEEGKHVSHGKD